MIFPELRAAIKALLSDKGEPLSLNLKESGVVYNDASWYVRNGYPQIAEFSGGTGTTWADEAVTRETALGHSAMWAAYRLICETMGRIPAAVMIKDAGGKRDAPDHPMFSAMHDEPHPEISAQTFREILTGYCLLEGDGFAKIERRSGTGIAIELKPLMPEQVKVDREKQGKKRLVYIILKENGSVDTTYTVERNRPHDILHLRGISKDGIRGYSVLKIGRNAIATALAAERNVARFWANGGRVPSHIEMVGKFKTTGEFDKFRNDVENILRQPGKIPIFENDAKYKPTGLSMVDAQALESRQFAVTEFCRLTGVSPHLVADLSRATFSNIENLFIEFKTVTLATWANRWSQDFRRCIFTPEEKTKGYFLHHNINALMLGDFAARMTGYAQGIQNGFLNADEVRDLEDRNPIPGGGGQSYHYQLNMQTVPGTGDPTISEQRMLAATTKPTTTDQSSPKGTV